MTYGTLCFAIFFSFVGTVLGGLWADDSWGRFWGWDPKENGALIIVLWNALVLHARWGGMVKDRGFAMLAIGGNIVVAWSLVRRQRARRRPARLRCLRKQHRHVALHLCRRATGNHGPRRDAVRMVRTLWPPAHSIRGVVLLRTSLRRALSIAAFTAGVK